MRPTSILLTILALLGPAAQCALAQTTIHVPSEAATIQAALDQAAQGDTVLVAPGSYTVNSLRTWGKALHLVSENGAAATVLTGAGANRVFYIRDNENIATVVEGFTISSGRAANGSAGSTGNGGGNILVSNASPLFRDCVIQSGRAGTGGSGSTAGTGASGGYGGGLYVLNGSPRFDKCIFRDNDAGLGGTGGVGTTGANGTFTSHHAGNGGTGGTGGPGGVGGAVYVTGAASNPVFANCLFHHNQAGRGGTGGKGGTGGNGYTFSIADGDGGDGGKGGTGGNGGHATLYVTGSASAVVTSCTFEHNYLADRGAGGAGGSKGSGEPDGSNGAVGSVGGYSIYAGIYAASGPVEVHNTVLWDHNSYADGGTSLALVELDGVTSSINSAARTTITGTNCFLLPTNPFDAQWLPLAGSAIVDAGNETLLPNWTSGDLDGGTRLFDSALVAGLSRLDMGALERSRGEWLQLGCGTNVPGSLVATGAPTIGQSFTLGVDDPSAHIHPGAVPILWVSASAAPGPCGTVVPGYGMNDLADGALLVDISAPAVLFQIGAPWTTPGTPAVFTLPVGASPSLVGVEFYVQGALFDTVDLRFGAAEGLHGLIGD